MARPRWWTACCSNPVRSTERTPTPSESWIPMIRSVNAALPSSPRTPRLIGTTKNTIQSIRDRTHWNSAYLNPVDPVSIGLCTQIDLDKEVQKASKRIENRKKKEEKEKLESTTLSEIDETNELAEALDTNNEEKSNELDEAENKETELDLNKDEPTISEENKEYDSDSVFAKLQELKKD